MLNPSKKTNIIETGVIQEWNDVASTDASCWNVYYKKVSFGCFGDLRAASLHLEKLLELDVTAKQKKPPEPPPGPQARDISIWDTKGD